MPAMARRERGLTLTECCVSLGIAVLMVMVALPAFTDILRKRHLEGRAGELSTDLQLLRTEAVARNATARITLSSDLHGDCYVLHTGNAGDCVCSAEAPPTCDAGAQAIKSVSFPAAGPVRLAAEKLSTGFDPVRGNAHPANTFTVKDDSGREVRHVVSFLGRVRSCTTSAALLRYAPC
jgi:type IV fimbrial biogenesis protein FimT